MNAPMT